MKRVPIVPLSVFFACLAATLALAGHGEAAVAPIRVLFIGNSYTLYNDLPRMVAEMGRSLGYDVRPATRAVGGASFAYHRRSAKTLEKIGAERWDAVILQNFSLAPGLRPEDVRRGSLSDAVFLAQRIMRADPAARIIYYATWGRRDGDRSHCRYYPRICAYDGHTAALQEGYRIYREATGGLIAPVGINWQRVVHDNPAERPFAPRSLWVRGGSHPSRLGSYLAAATILKTIIAAPVSGASYTAGLPTETALYLLRIADVQ